MENCDEQQRWRRDDEFVSRSEGETVYGESIDDWREFNWIAPSNWKWYRCERESEWKEFSVKRNNFT